MNPTIQDPSGRGAHRLEWARGALGDPYAQLERASMDAGFRSYWRSLGDGPGRIVMDSPPGLEDVRPWLSMRELLVGGDVRVPEVLAIDIEHGFLLLEDLGGPTLAHVISEDNADTWFDAALEQLLRLQAIAPPAGMGEFGEALLQRDAGLFDEWFLRRHLGLVLDCGESEGLELAQRRLMDNALGQARVLTHRDFMPRNLMPVTPGPAVLDFQDCVRGPIAYDAMSLFKDAFLSWPEERVRNWLQDYWQLALPLGIPVQRDFEEFLRASDLMGVQRHLKVIGIFARICHRDGKPRYLADVPRFFSYIEAVLARRPELAELGELFASLGLTREVDA